MNNATIDKDNLAQFATLEGQEDKLARSAKSNIFSRHKQLGQAGH